MKNFALIGVGGYIAPRHLKAIKETNNNLVVALDNNDSVGILDGFFPYTKFFTEFERFDRHIEKLRRTGNENQVDYVSICSPNYLHDAHIRFAMRVHANAICEKPLVLNPWNLDALKEIENESDRKIYNILQLRHHPKIIELKNSVKNSKKIHDIDVETVTPRGGWYHVSWKGDVSKSGGIVTNIGVHIIDMLIWIFGDVEENIVHLHADTRASGILRLKKANIRWFLSIERDDLKLFGAEKTYRSIKIDGEKFEYADGFADLHTQCYRAILEGKGNTIDDARKAIETVYNIRNSSPSSLYGDYHPILKSL
ncbi:MAG: Gfo/Idh/MocA family oxidoreductase [Candidatus Delongbacteria bacterium]|nr:Gfo/Idh/MocA family oxidoreductase [Candidatus Delongbacteria bacterium]MBN2836938.1 Gfo/Idh/MocA family oxidoreductase [Candidatus Delongbacteria bacterium]